jgi:diguanylate cyclase (GGDEF)-like protein
VYVASLVLLVVGTIAAIYLAASHVRAVAISASAAQDRPLVSSILGVIDLTGGMHSETDAEQLAIALQQQVAASGVAGLAVLRVDGTVVASAGADAPGGVGQSLAVAAGRGEAQADLIGTQQRTWLVEYFPALANGSPVGIIRVIRDGSPIASAVEQASRDIMLGTAVGAAALLSLLFIVFGNAQTRLDQQAAQLVEASRRDPLTGQLTYGAAVAALAEVLDTLMADAPVAVALVDLDNFRSLNEVQGSDVGDRALRVVGEALAASASSTDFVGRSGPDEFLIVAPGHDSRDLQVLMEAVRQRLAAAGLQAPGAEQLPISISVGICVAPLHGRTPTELIATAAAALGEAKTAGGGEIVIGQLSFTELSTERLSASTVLRGLIQAIDRRDHYTARHADDVARWALFLAGQIGLEADEAGALYAAALLHDVGKIAVPDDVLRKPGPLTLEEQQVMRQHVELGALLTRDLPQPGIVDGIRHHHERWDGEGYPDRLSGEVIPLSARIIAVADAFSAMTTTRPYRKALPGKEALVRLGEVAGTQLDPRLTDLFIIGMESDVKAPIAGDHRQPSAWLPRETAA